jgi:cytidine deaminase
MENACYRLGICAEIAALTAAAQAFGLGRVVRIAVSGGHIGANGALAGQSLVTPCGGCRQAILEAAHVAGWDVEVLAANGDGEEVRVLRISELIPFGFGPPISPMRSRGPRRLAAGACGLDRRSGEQHLKPKQRGAERAGAHAPLFPVFRREPAHRQIEEDHQREEVKAESDATDPCQQEVDIGPACEAGAHAHQLAVRFVEGEGAVHVHIS